MTFSRSTRLQIAFVMSNLGGQRFGPRFIEDDGGVDRIGPSDRYRLAQAGYPASPGNPRGGTPRVVGERLRWGIKYIILIFIPWGVDDTPV